VSHFAGAVARELFFLMPDRVEEANMLDAYLASIPDLTIHQVVRCIPDFYKPFEFMKVDQCPILPEPWRANCFF
jgi:hypothetical protein